MLKLSNNYSPKLWVEAYSESIRYAHDHSLRAEAICTFAAKYNARHPELQATIPKPN
jgi:hypothetical protein